MNSTKDRKGVSRRINRHDRLSSYRKLLPFIVPAVFFLFGTYWILTVRVRLELNSFLLVKAAWDIFNGYGYTGLASEIYPPLYSLLTACFGVGNNFELGGRILSLIGGTGLLILLPHLTKLVRDNFVSGILAQAVIGSTPSFFMSSVRVENNMLNAFFIVGTIVFGMKYLGEDQEKIPIRFIVFANLACLTRHMSLIIVGAFILLLFFLTVFERNWVSFGKISTSVIALPLAWNGYRLISEGPFVVSTVKLFNIPLSMAKYGFLEVNQSTLYPYLVMSERFGVSKLISEHPVLYADTILLNLYSFIITFFYNLPIFGVYFWFVALGFFVSLYYLRWEKLDFCFLYFSFLLFATTSILTRVHWKYFIHLGVIFGTVGVSYFYEYTILFIKAISPNRTVQLGLFTMILAGVTFHQVRSIQLTETPYIPDSFYRRSMNEIERFKEQHPPSGNLVMAPPLPYLPMFYQEGYKPIPTFLPEADPEELFCYRVGDPSMLRLFVSLTYPPVMETIDTLPPDYLLMSDSFREALSYRGELSFLDFIPYLKEVGEWESIRGEQLYRVRKGRIECSDTVRDN